MVVSAELEVGDALWGGVDEGKELVEVLGRRVVRARRADDVEFLQAEFRLQRPQCVDLARDADDGDARVPRIDGGLEQLQQGRITHAHAAAGGHVLRLGDKNGLGPPAVVGVGGHAEHGADQTGLQQSFPEPCRDTCPLRAFAGPFHGGAVHRHVRPEEQLVRAHRVAASRRPGVATTAMHGPLQPRVIRCDELAGASAALGVVGTADAAVGAEVSERRFAGHGPSMPEGLADPFDGSCSGAGWPCLQNMARHR